MVSGLFLILKKKKNFEAQTRNGRTRNASFFLVAHTPRELYRFLRVSKGLRKMLTGD